MMASCPSSEIEGLRHALCETQRAYGRAMSQLDVATRELAAARVARDAAVLDAERARGEAARLRAVNMLYPAIAGATFGMVLMAAILHWGF